MITEMNESKTLKNTYNANINVNLLAENVIQIKKRITRNVDASLKIKKNMMCAKKIIF